MMGVRADLKADSDAVDGLLVTSVDYDAISSALLPDQLAHAIGAEKSASGSYHCPGPGHVNGDRNPSLSISRRESRTVARCFGCGLKGSPVQVAAELWSVPHSEAAEYLASLIGVARAASHMTKVAGHATKAESHKLGEVDCTYEYVDENGGHLFEVVRYQSKEFRQRRKQGRGWSWKVGGVRRVLYRLPELLAGIEAGRQVFVCEGEKDAGNVTALGFVATTNAMGAGNGKWESSYSQSLNGGRICILSDNDNEGRDHAQRVAHALHGIAAEVRVLELPDLPPKGDVSDWIDAGGTTEQLKAFVLAAPIWEPENSPPTETVSATNSDPHCTDLGNSQRFVRLHGERMRYVHEWGAWLVWDGTRWAHDKTGRVETMAKNTTYTIHEEALNLKDRSRAEAMSKHAYRTESEARLNSMISLARTEEGIAVLAEELDADPWLLNVLNGTIDLRTGKLLPHDPKRLITKIAPIEYDADATAPRWDAFLSRIMDNKDVVAFLQRAIGYSLTGLTHEHVLLFLYGLGGNGKSTFLDTLLAILGEYGLQAEPGLLIQQRTDSHPTGTAALKGARLVVSSEIQDGRNMAESRVKHLTGGDRISARKMRQDFFEFEPTHTLWLMANHKPTIKGTDEAIWRRILLVPFNVKIPPDEEDIELKEKLRAEGAGILSWAVRGCLAWQQKRLDAPAEVRTATRAYRDSQDVLGAFISDRCLLAENASASAGDLYTAYKFWADETGERARPQRDFGIRLQERGLERFKQIINRRFAYRGIGLNKQHETIGNDEDVTPLEISHVESIVKTVSHRFTPPEKDNYDLGVIDEPENATADTDDYERDERDGMQTEEDLT